MPATIDLQLPVPEGFTREAMVCRGLELKVVTSGAGPLILLLHGLGGSCEDYYPLMENLAPSFKCIALDWPGFGFSAKPDIDYGIDLFCSLLKDIITQLPKRPFAVGGHSMGGHVILKYAIDNPGELDNIIAICPAGGHIDSKWYHRLLFTFWVKKNDQLRHVRPVVMKHIAMWPFADRGSEICRNFGEKFIVQWYDESTHDRERALVRSGRSILETPIGQNAELISSRVLMITGAKDHITPAKDTSRLASSISDLKQVVVDRGHMALYTAVAPISKAITDFLN